MKTSDNDAQALLRLAGTLERAARQLRQLAGGSPEAPKRKTGLQEGYVEELRSVERTVAAQKLIELTHAQLGEVYVELGGIRRDKKRSKDWLIERCLWYLFDFQAGHDIVKGTRGESV